ncbi:MAG: hypothetical protein GY811_08400 [Myxococcales bacterium]|nr:hypothetical protein [Myxococcales bacterium]
MNRFCIACALLLAACGVSKDDGFTGNDGGGGGDGGGGEFADAGEPEVCSKMDILFVIDDSGSMSEEQSNLGQNFPRFISVLDNFMADGGLLDYRIAITTTGRDVDYTLDPNMGLPFPLPIPPIPMSEDGDNGVMRKECGMTERWIDRTDSNVSSTFSCVADVGIGGPTLEMPLYTTQLALGDRMNDGTNSGFLREDSLLAVVILTDEDDCSRTDNGFTIVSDRCGSSNPDFLPPSNTIDFLDSLTGARGRWATAVIAGPSSCTSSFGDASHAENLQQFVAETGENAVFSSICDGDLTTALADAVGTFDAACRGLDPID